MNIPVIFQIAYLLAALTHPGHIVLKSIGYIYFHSPFIYLFFSIQLPLSRKYKIEVGIYQIIMK
ncbi:hypothetical protein EAE91_20310 [Photorhabdus noenieputensis]|nr:hypothetical protein [Photorhabdus noenieputensis]